MKKVFFVFSVDGKESILPFEKETEAVAHCNALNLKTSGIRHDYDRVKLADDFDMKDLQRFIKMNPTKKMQDAFNTWFDSTFMPVFYMETPEPDIVRRVFVVFSARQEMGIHRIYLTEASASQEALRCNVSSLEELSAGYPWFVEGIEITKENKRVLSGQNEEKLKSWIMTHATNKMHMIWEKELVLR